MSTTSSVNNLRLSGLFSGMDTDTVVKGMLSTYQTRIDKQNQASTKYQWKIDAYRDVNNLIKNFRTKYMSVLSSSNMMTSSAYNIYSVNMLSDTSAVSITANSTASTGTLTINNIQQLAETASVKSTDVFTGETYSSSATLADIELANAFEFDVNGELSFSINGETFTFAQDTTIGALMSEVNSSDAGVRMSFSSLTKGFKIESNNTGSASEADIVNISGNAFSAGGAFGITEGVYNGQDAVCTIEGIAVTQASNTFSYDGITYTLKDTSASAISFSVGRDAQSTVDKVKDFISAYNDLVEDLQNRLGEEVYRDYTPLTDDQKDQMSEDDIKLWEDKAKSGMLHSDSYVSNLLSTLRSAFYTQVEGTGMTLSSIGLSTGVYTDGAKITVDEDKLKTAIENNPDVVKNMFVQSPTDANFSGSGLIMRISNSMLAYTKQTTDGALDSLQTELDDAKAKVSTLQTQMDDREEALWKRFSAMETALAKMNSTSSWLSSLFTSTSS